MDKFNNSIVLDAIENVVKTGYPKKFAESNETCYDVANETTEIVKDRLCKIIKQINWHESIGTTPDEILKDIKELLEDFHYDLTSKLHIS